MGKMDDMFYNYPDVTNSMLNIIINSVKEFM